MEAERALRHPAPRGILDLAVIFAALTAVVMLAVDEPLARWLYGYQPSGMWDLGIDGLEVVTLAPVSRWTTSLVVVGGMIACVAVPRLRTHAPAWMWLAATHIVSRLLMSYAKTWTGRLRPTEWLSRFEAASTWGWAREGYSFPSGHVVQFASLAIPIGVLDPRARWPLAIVVAFVVVARIAVDAHFVSDTLGALALTGLVAWLTGLAIRPRR